MSGVGMVNPATLQPSRDGNLAGYDQSVLFPAPSQNVRWTDDGSELDAPNYGYQFGTENLSDSETFSPTLFYTDEARGCATSSDAPNPSLPAPHGELLIDVVPPVGSVPFWETPRHAGDADVSSSCHTEVYNSETGKWSPGPCEDSSESLQNRVCYKDSANREYVYFVDKSSEQVVMSDLKANQCVQRFIKRPIPHARSGSRLVTAHILRCGGSIFLYSEQEVGRKTFSCIHKLNPDRFVASGRGMWENIHVHPKTTLIPGGSPHHLYPEFTHGRPLSATMVECSGSAFVFSEQEDGNAVFIRIQKRDLRGDDLIWEDVMPGKKKRCRRPDWTSQEITLYLQAKVEALDAVPPGKRDWDYVSESLQSAGFFSSPKACEDLWGTLLKNLTRIENYFDKIHTPGSSSAPVSVWNMTESDRAQNHLPRLFTREWYFMMKRIHEKKPRKPVVAQAKKPRKPKVAQAKKNPTSSFLNDSSVTFANCSGLRAVEFPSATPASTSQSSAESLDDESDPGAGRHGINPLLAEVKAIEDFLLQGRPKVTNDQIAEVKDAALGIVRSRLELQILKEKNKGCEIANHKRRRKSRKTDA